MQELIKIVLKSGKDQSMLRFHPWVFSGAIKKIYGSVKEGDLVKVYNNKDQYLGTGHYQPGSIAIRIVTFNDEPVDDAFWFNRIEKAWNWRLTAGLHHEQNNIFRMINAEGDQMPGLVVDFYNGILVFQAHSMGMYAIRDVLVKAFKEILGEKLTAVYDKSESTLSYKADGRQPNSYLYGKGHGKAAVENGLLFKIGWETGQKTGFFIDQRENRELLSNYSRDKKVLNMFGYTGGFSVYALAGKAKLVHSVDSSGPAIDLTRENVALNFADASNHEAYCTDAFKYLEEMEENAYDVIVLDPPAFAKHHNVLNNALQGYKKLNSKAIAKIAPGGILFTFSCSQAVSRENFRKSVFTAATHSGRAVQILHQLTQPVDHPVSIYHPEGEYLKGLVVRVD